jgi:hypothetical protein
MPGPLSTITITPNCVHELSLSTRLARLPTAAEVRTFVHLLSHWSARPVSVVFVVAAGSVERCSGWVDALGALELGDVEVRFVPERHEEPPA